MDELYDVTRMNLAGIGPVVLGQHMPSNRWNGFLCPRFDALTCVEVLEYLTTERDSDILAWSFHDDGSLQVSEGGDTDERYDEWYEPDEDGLFALGSHGWVWSEAEHRHGWRFDLSVSWCYTKNTATDWCEVGE